MNDSQIQLLQEALKATKNVWWKDADNKLHKVTWIALNWIEDPDQPDLVEPAAMLNGAGAVALYFAEPDSFFAVNQINLGE